MKSRFTYSLLRKKNGYYFIAERNFKTYSAALRRSKPKDLIQRYVIARGKKVLIDEFEIFYHDNAKLKVSKR